MRFLVTLEMPQNVTREEMEAYILNAVCGSCGALHPEDPLFDLDRDRVCVEFFHGNKIKAHQEH